MEQKTGPLVHLTESLANNYKVSRSGRLLCIAIVLVVRPRGYVFHTSSRWVKQHFTPPASAERDAHVEVSGVYLWLVIDGPKTNQSGGGGPRRGAFRSTFILG